MSPLLLLSVLLVGAAVSFPVNESPELQADAINYSVDQSEDVISAKKVRHASGGGGSGLGYVRNKSTQIEIELAKQLSAYMDWLDDVHSSKKGEHASGAGGSKMVRSGPSQLMNSWTLARNSGGPEEHSNTR